MVRNSIILVDFIELRLEEGMPGGCPVSPDDDNSAEARRVERMGIPISGDELRPSEQAEACSHAGGFALSFQSTCPGWFRVFRLA